MPGRDWAYWLPIALAAVQTIYGVATFHKDHFKLSATNRPLRIMASFVALSWLAVFVNYKLSPTPDEGKFLNYGIDAQNVFHGVVSFSNWSDFKDHRALLITRTVFSDRDRMSDDWIAKSVPYTITGPTLVMALVNNGTMHFGAGVANHVEYDFVVLPEKITPDKITTLGDVEKLGGKILSSSAQGGIIGAAPPAPAQ